MNATLQDWLGTFWKVLVSPTPRTFLAEAGKASDKFSSAVAWLVIFAIYTYIVGLLGIAPLSVSALVADVLLVPLVVILFTSAMHFVYQRISGRKVYLYDKLLYLTVAILLPLQVVLLPVSLFAPDMIFLILIYALFLYQVALLVIALKTIAQIEYWRALVSVFAAIVAGVFVFLCTLPFIISMLGGVQSTVR